MNRKQSEKNPFKMHTTTRRDRLTGEAVKWYERATWLQGKALQIPADERTAFQQDLDELWEAVDSYEKGVDTPVDTTRLEKLFGSFFVRWPTRLGKESPPLLR